jgi:PAS domain S-box-containing protein
MIIEHRFLRTNSRLIPAEINWRLTKGNTVTYSTGNVTVTIPVPDLVRAKIKYLKATDVQKKKSIQDILDPNFARLLLESMADGVFTLDEKGKITSWNPSMERITGYSAVEAIGKSCMFLSFSRCFSNTCPTGINQCGILEQSAVDAKECFLRHKEGHNVSVVKSARTVLEKDSIRGVVETVTDMTELQKARRKAEEASLPPGGTPQIRKHYRKKPSHAGSFQRAQSGGRQ